MLSRVKNKRTNKIVYFRFFSENDPEEFWYTDTAEATGFCYGNVINFEPIGKSWNDLLLDELDKDLL